MYNLYVCFCIAENIFNLYSVTVVQCSSGDNDSHSLISHILIISFTANVDVSVAEAQLGADQSDYRVIKGEAKSLMVRIENSGSDPVGKSDV